MRDLGKWIGFSVCVGCAAWMVMIGHPLAAFGFAFLAMCVA